MGIPDVKYSQETVGFVVPRAATSVAVEDILEYCVQRLPPEKVPVEVVAIGKDLFRAGMSSQDH